MEKPGNYQNGDEIPPGALLGDASISSISEPFSILFTKSAGEPIANRGFRGGVSSGALMALLMLLLMMFFMIPGRYEMQGQSAGVVASILSSTPTAVSLVVGGCAGGLFRKFLRSR